MLVWGNNLTEKTIGSYLDQNKRFWKNEICHLYKMQQELYRNLPLMALNNCVLPVPTWASTIKLLLVQYMCIVENEVYKPQATAIMWSCKELPPP